MDTIEMKGNHIHKFANHRFDKDKDLQHLLVNTKKVN